MTTHGYLTQVISHEIEFFCKMEGTIMEAVSFLFMLGQFKHHY